ncbi:hypothetical protein [Halostella sp. PRR32]|uniref:hypothetical protein n=1 Tax=Halostella sp. PRR32 TaxID=3098147 RepID=UPI002B1E867C|nr:hypothetical protein [Halostella sp. PRR32]
MKRRTYLRLLPATAVAGAAGCSSSGDEPDEGDDTDADTDTDTETATTESASTTEPTATPEESLDAAAAALNEASEGIGTQSDAFGEDEESFDESGIRQSITTANDHLDAAEEADLSEDQQADVEDMRNVAAYFSLLTDTMLQLDRGFNEVDVAQSYVDTERFDDGIESLDDARSAFRDASDDLSDAEDAFEALDEGSFERIDGTTYAEVEDSMQMARQLVDMMDPFLTGYREFVRGYERFTVATTALDEERYQTAADEYSTASVRFGDAESAFTDAEEFAPADMQSSVISLTCYAAALADASEHFAEAARALDEGDDQTANEEAEAGQEAVSRCDSSPAALAMPAL